MAGNENRSKNTPRHSPGDRTRKAVLATTAGVVPLALSMFAGSIGSRPARSHSTHREPTFSSSDLQFVPDCRMPFKSDPVPAIDGECGIEGTGNTDKKIAESKAKNEFCVPTSKITHIEYKTFTALQDATSFRSSADRSSLAKVLPENGGIGEGTYVE